MVVKELIVAAVLIIGLGFFVEAEKAAPEKVAYVIVGSLGDQSFFDSGYEGIKRIGDEFGVETRVLECNFDPSIYYPSIRNAAQWADVIFVISYGFEEELKTVAGMFPDKIFVNIDTIVQDDGGIISSIDFKEEEGAFLAGTVAAIVTTMEELPGINSDKIIGAVGGDDDVVIRSFIYGYEQGAHYIDPEMKVKTIYVGAWNDPVKGKQAALQLYAQGVDIIFHIASLTGSGVIQAAAEEGKYVIGVDSNQNGLAPGHVVTSDLKEVGNAICMVYDRIVDGTYRNGEIYRLGVKEKVIGLAIDEHTRGILPEETIQRIIEIENGVADGSIQVKSYSP